MGVVSRRTHSPPSSTSPTADRGTTSSKLSSSQPLPACELTTFSVRVKEKSHTEENGIFKKIGVTCQPKIVLKTKVCLINPPLEITSTLNTKRDTFSFLVVLMSHLPPTVEVHPPRGGLETTPSCHTGKFICYTQ